MPKAKEVIACELCNAHGFWNNNVCPGCGGAGKFIDPGKWAYCGACNGHGHVVVREPTGQDGTYTLTSHSGTVKPCPGCGGAGKVFAKNQKSK